jgi:hypothetical protein
MNAETADTSIPTDSSAPPPPPPPPSAPTQTPLEWRAYAHLYLPIVTIILLIVSVSNPFDHPLAIAASAIPTYLLGSLIYPKNRPAFTPEQMVRFTRKDDKYRAGVMLTYGRLFGTPFNLVFYMVDLMASYAIGQVIGEREAAPVQRRSEFFVHALWAAANHVLMLTIPSSWETLWLLVGMVDRTLFRAMYLALVDDVVRVLGYPRLRTWKDKMVVMLVQAAVITVPVMLLHARQVVIQTESMEAADAAFDDMFGHML